VNAPSKTPTIMTSRQFNQDTARAKRAAAKGPVFITDRGRPSHVLITKEEYDRLEKRAAEPDKPFRSLAETLADNRPEADFDFEIPEFKGVFKGFEFD
jgi:prevent-host-death family protein